MFTDDNADTLRTLRNIRKSIRNRLRDYHKIESDKVETLVDEILHIHGIHKEHFDFVSRIDAFVTGVLNDKSIDANSNKNEKTTEAIMQESLAPVRKAIGFDYLYRELREMFGKSTAQELMSEIYDYSLGLSDSTNILRPYCWALDASKIVTVGRDFGQLHSAPSQRIQSYISALCETIHQMSSHLAGAIAVGSFFLDVAHILLYGKNIIDLFELRTTKKYRKMLENEFQQFVHSVNHLSRNGAECVTEHTEILTPQGFKKYNQVEVGDNIYSYNIETKQLEIEPVQHVSVKEFDGEMHQYKGRDMCQTVTPEHRVVKKVYNSKNNEIHKVRSSEIFEQQTPIDIPVIAENVLFPDYEISDEEIQILAFILTNGHIKGDENSHFIQILKSQNRPGNKQIINCLKKLGCDFHVEEIEKQIEIIDSRKKYLKKYKMNEYNLSVESSIPFIDMLEGDRTKIPEFLTKLNRRQSKLFIDSWQMFDGQKNKKGGRNLLRCDNDEIRDSLQHIAFIAGFGTSIEDVMCDGYKKQTKYLVLYNRPMKSITERKITNFTGKVWCPTTNNGVVVYRENGRVYISGNSPFTNVSIFDRVKLRTLVKDMSWYFPFDKLPINHPDDMEEEEREEFYYKYIIDYIIEIQDIFIDFFDKGDPLRGGSPLRFPVCTLNLSKVSTKGYDIELEDGTTRFIPENQFIYAINNETQEKVRKPAKEIFEENSNVYNVKI